jgi:hypothetical protein
LASAMVFAKLQSTLLAGTLLGFAALLAWRKTRRVRALAALAGGAAIVPAFFLLMFLRVGVLQHFWLSYFGRNTAYALASRAPFVGRLRLALFTLRNVTAMGPFLLGLFPVWFTGIAAAAALTLSSLRKREWRMALAPAPTPVILLLASCILLLAGWITAAAPGNPFPHYLLFLEVPFALVTGSAVMCLLAAGEQWSWQWPAAVALACFVVVTCLIPSARGVHAIAEHETAWNKPRYQPAVPLVSTIQRYSSNTDLLVVWGWNSELYVASGRAPGTRFADSVMQLEPSAYRDYFRQVYVEDFLHSRPPVFVDAVGPGAFRYTDRASLGYESLAGLRETVERDYRQIADIDGARVFVRHDRRDADAASMVPSMAALRRIP